MGTIRAWLSRLGDIFDKQRRDREPAEELESHLAFHIDDIPRRTFCPLRITVLVAEVPNSRVYY